jgi:hypothetical protein
MANWQPLKPATMIAIRMAASRSDGPLFIMQARRAAR